jgi:hypothetical protein
VATTTRAHERIRSTNSHVFRPYHRRLQGHRASHGAELAQRGHRVVATARNPQTLDDLDVDRRLSLDVTDPRGMISPERVASTLADLIERTTVSLRVPVGPWAERVIAARNVAPYDRPFSRPTSS